MQLKTIRVCCCYCNSSEVTTTAIDRPDGFSRSRAKREDAKEVDDEDEAEEVNVAKQRLMERSG